jgi:DNA-binding PadR family transcriptional regulator
LAFDRPDIQEPALDISLTKRKTDAVSDPRRPSMSPTESLVMELLRGGERYGLELVDASGGALKRGSVYVILARMEVKGFIESRQEERAEGAGGLPRRLYRATVYGLKVHEAFALLREALALKAAEAQ